MIADFDDFVTWMFVIIDDLWQEIAPLYQRPGPEPSTCSDSELMSVALVSECRIWDRETEAMQEWTAYRHLFPRLPERSRFNRRRRNPMGAINQIRHLALTMLDVAQDAYDAATGCLREGRSFRINQRYLNRHVMLFCSTSYIPTAWPVRWAICYHQR